VNIDVFRRTGRTESVAEIEEDSERTYFTEAAIRWRDLNVSSAFKAYLGEISLLWGRSGEEKEKVFFFFFFFFDSFRFYHIL
jgi:hypothetical protein